MLSGKQHTNQTHKKPHHPTFPKGQFRPALARLKTVTGGSISFTLESHSQEPLMNIEIHDTALEARIQKQIQATGAASAEEALLRLLETQEEQDRWLLENKNAIHAKIRRGIDQLDRGEGIPEDQLDAYLAKLKAKPE